MSNQHPHPLKIESPKIKNIKIDLANEPYRSVDLLLQNLKPKRQRAWLREILASAARDGDITLRKMLAIREAQKAFE